MKIKSLEIENNKILKNIKIDFQNNDKVLDTIVVAGINGSGKTTLLESVYYGIKNIIENKKEICSFEFQFEENEKAVFNNEKDFFQKLNLYNYYQKNKPDYFNSDYFYSKLNILPKIIYIPSEIKFDEIKNAVTNLKQEYKFLNVIDNNIIKDVPSYIASKVIYTANTEENLTMKQAREKVYKEINGIFEILDIDVKLYGVSQDEKSIPIFINSVGEKFDINGLSSGEKQLFLRTLSIKMLEPKNSIILIDEPELSLHPKWQQKIVEVYKKIGKNNQVIIATHSPHILGSVPNENIFILSKNENGEMIYLKGGELENSYGQPVDRILEDIMGMETTRDVKVYKLLEEVRKLVREDKYQENEFKEKYQKLTDILGMADSDLLLINMEIQRRKRGVKNV